MSESLFPVTFIVKTQDDVKVLGAQITIWNASFSSVVIPKLLTDGDGKVVVGLPNGSFRALAFLSNAYFPGPYVVTVAEGSSVINITAKIQEVSEPPEGCVTIYGWVKNLHNEPVVTRVYVSISQPQIVGNESIKTVTSVIQTNENGYFEAFVRAGLKVNLQIPEAGVSTTGIVPFGGQLPMERLGDRTA